MKDEILKELADVEKIHWWYKGLRDLVFYSIQRALDTKPEARILDAGCGTGFLTKSLEKYGISFGIDISDTAMELCRKRGAKRIVKGSVSALPYRDDSFNLVLLLDVLGHKAIDEAQAINEIYRVLKKGGILIINVAAHDYLWRNYDERWYWKHRYSKAELRDKLEKNKFKTITISYRCTFLFPLLLFLKFTSGSFSKKRYIDDLKPPFWPLNALLYALLKIENSLLKVINMPIGTSLFCVLKK